MSCFTVKGVSSAQLDPILFSHGWINLAPAKKIDKGVSYPLTLPSGCSTTTRIVKKHHSVVCETPDCLSRSDCHSLKRTVHRMLSLDFPMKVFRDQCRAMNRPDILKLAQKGWGRMFRSPTLWEDAVKTLCTTNASWSHTQRMCRSLCECFGKETPSGDMTFPSATVISKETEEQLTALVGVGYRARSLRELALQFSQHDHHRLLSLPPEGAEETVLSWRGFGKYATSHLMVLLGHHGFLPVDREVALSLGTRKRGERMPTDEHDHFEEWGQFRFTAYKLTRVASRLNWIGS